MTAYVCALLQNILHEKGADLPLQVVHLEGVVLFVDIAGSTSLVNEFAEAGPHGVETLHRVLNEYFGALFATVAQHDGDVIAIHGDAVLALWRATSSIEEAARAAAAAAVHIRDRTGASWSAGNAHLQHRLVLTAGPLQAVAGHAAPDQRYFVLTGSPIQALGTLAHSGTPGEIVVADGLVAHLGRSASLERSESGTWLLTNAAPVDARSGTPPVPAATTPLDDRARAFVPPMLSDRLAATDAEWLAEFRMLTAIFVQLPDVEWSRPERIDDAVQAIEEAIAPFELKLFDVTVDDKALVAVIASGLPPFAHERNAVRAVEAARKLRTSLLELGTRCGIGIATGRAFCGDVGNALRREGMITGPVMNRAARLMELAPGIILLDHDTAIASADYFEFAKPAAIAVKGSTEPVMVHRGDLAEPSISPARTARHALVGREDEVRALAGALEAISPQGGHVIAIEAEAGAGKSRLLSYAAAQARERKHACIELCTSPVEVGTAYFACRAFVKELLLQPDDRRDDVGVLRSRLQEALRADALRDKAALVEDILPLGLEERGLADEITGPARYSGLEEIMVHLAAARSAARPLVLLIDDLHWMDDRSARLLLALVRRVDRVLAVLSTRPLDERALPHVKALFEAADSKLVPGRLDRGAIVTMMCDLLGVRSVPPSLAEFVHSHSEGLPFHAEQLLLSLRDQGAVVVADGRCRVTAELAAGRVPTSLRDSIVSRIDTLDLGQQVILKIASVIGRSFRLDMLRNIAPEETSPDALRGMLAHMAAVGMIEGDTAQRADGVCAFRHVIIQETTYELLTFEQSRPLHARIAEYIETRYAEDLEPHYAELAEHREGAAQVDAAVEYWRKAAQLALRRYANYDALRHVDRIERLGAQAEIALSRAQEGELAQIRADACHELSRFAEAQRHFARCAALNDIPVPSTRTAVAASAARELTRQALHRMGVIIAPSDPRVQARERLTAHIYTRFAEHAYFSGDALRLLHGTVTSLNHAERVQAVAEVVEGFGGLAIGLGTARLHGLARFYRDRSIRRAESEGRLHDRGFAHLLAAVYSFQAGAWEEAEHHCGAGAAICERIGDRFRHQSCCVIQAYQDLLLGRYAAAEHKLRSLGEDADDVENIPVRAWVLAGRAILDMIRGRPASTALDRIASARDETLHRAERLLCDGLEALAHLEVGDDDQALRAADAGLANMLEAPPTMGIALVSIGGVAEVYLELARREPPASDAFAALSDRAGKACSAAASYAFKTAIFRPRARLLAGRLDLLRGHRRRAEAQWRKALAYATEARMPFERASALLALASVAVDADESRQREQKGNALLRDIEANPWRFAARVPPVQVGALALHAPTS